MIVAPRFHDYQCWWQELSDWQIESQFRLSYACDKKPSLLVLLLLMMLLLFLMMPKLELASAVPRQSVFWSFEVAILVGRAFYLRMFNWVLSAGNKYIPKYGGLSTALPRPDIPYSQDARLPSSPVTCAPGRCLNHALRGAFIYLPARLGRSASYQESIVPFMWNFDILFNSLFN